MFKEHLREIIAERHKHILDAYLDGCEIYVNDTRGFVKCDNFIATYYSEHYYEAVPKSLEDCHCEASELHYNKLGFHNSLCENNNTIFIGNCGVHSKKIQFNEQLNQWTYCPYEETKMLTTAQLEDILEEEQLNNFKDYGFEADFAGEILKEVYGYYIGYTISNDHKIVDEERWRKDGICLSSEFHLKPIKKEWYEDDKYNNIKLLIQRAYRDGYYDGANIRKQPNPENTYQNIKEEEILSLYYETKTPTTPL